ncbi:GspH/FimT family pseudopilin [Endozoicomonas sp. Mp262]|uniref:GspH/FimT family pseudopilin n=1 Tax=Endozoicomonas sp. Mp262 TaxID=2919499 RepID=UPI0021D886B1
MNFRPLADSPGARFLKSGKCAVTVDESSLLKSGQSGFTLIEVLVAVAIVGILASSFITMGDLVREYRVRYMEQRLYGALILARSEAIKRSGSVSVCKSSNASSCASGTGSDWEDGWIVFVDQNANRAVNGGDEIIRVYNNIPDEFKITWNYNQYLTFDSRGRANFDNSQKFDICLRYGGTGPVKTIEVFGRKKGGGRLEQTSRRSSC